MIILGINAYHGDSAACLVENGEVTAAIEEERLRRIKHYAGFPTLAIHACLKQRHLKFEDVDYVSISRNPGANFSAKALYAIAHGRKLSGMIRNRLQAASKVVHLTDQLKKNLGLHHAPTIKTFQVEHHLAHMASCYYPSPFEEAAILSIDGFGDFVSTKWGIGCKTKIESLGQVEFPHSAGVFYTALTQYLGFPGYGDEYKVMGLSGYGKPKYCSALRKIIRPNGAKGFQLNLDFFCHHSEGIEMNWEDGYPTQSHCFSPQLIELLGPARKATDPIDVRHLDIAASLQSVFEEIYFHLLNALHSQTQVENLSLAGGCALNVLANGKIAERTPFRHIFIQPAAGDAGTALGSALYTYHMKLRKSPKFPMRHTYYGPRFELAEVKKVFKNSMGSAQEMSEDNIIELAATALADGKIVGWFNDQMEFGPRALGNRSLLADPRRRDMKQIMNERIKQREEFRPFAPSILLEEATNYFEGNHSEPFMTGVRVVKESKRSVIPAVTHVDGTGRMHTVDRETNPRFWKLLKAFQRITGLPVLLNTSFNENEPIVCSPQDALACFARTSMDYLALGNFWITRNEWLDRTNKEEAKNVILAE